MILTKEEFDKLYKGKIDYRIFITAPKDFEDLVLNYATCKLWRLNNLYTIVSKMGKRIPFVMNYAQHIVYAASLEHPRQITLKSRQQGISTFWLLSFLDDGMFNEDFNIGLMAQGKSEAGTLLKRVKLAWEAFSPELKALLELKFTTDNKDEKAWTNNSTLFIRTSFRSSTLMRLHVSELGKIASKNPERVVELKTGTFQAIAPGNTLIIESTAEGDNEFRTMWNNAIVASNKHPDGRLGGKDFMPVFLSWVNDPDCVSDDEEDISCDAQKYFDKLEREEDIHLTKEQKNFWIQQYRELGERTYQEYPATPEEAFTKVNDGSYYATLFMNFVVKQKRLIANLYDPNLPVHIVMDLGLRDTFVLIYFQIWNNSLGIDEWRIIDEYTNSGEGLEHYVDQVRGSGYTIDKTFCPHDIEVTELSTNKTRKRALEEFGVTNITVLAKGNKEDGIEQVRSQLKNTWLDVKCVYLKGCFLQYSKEWDEGHNVWKASDTHNKWSHGADAIRYMHSSPISGKRTAKHTQTIDGIAF